MELKKRSEFPENELWDLTALYQDQEDFLRAIEKHVKKSMNLSVTTRVTSTPLKTSEAAFAIFEQIHIQLSHIGNYSFMPQTTDFGDEAFAEIAQAGMDFETWASVELSFFDDALVEADEEVLERLGQLPHLTFAIRQAKIKKLTTWELMWKRP